MIELTELQELMVLNRLRAKYGNLQVAHVALAARVGGAKSVSAVAKIVGCSRSTVRLCLKRSGHEVAEIASASSISR